MGQTRQPAIRLLVRRLAVPGMSPGRAGGRTAAPAGLPSPDREMSGFQCCLHHAGQVAADCVQVDRVLQPGRERGHRGLGVIPGPVEPAVHPVLHPPPHRTEQGRDCRILRIGLPRACAGPMMPAAESVPGSVDGYREGRRGPWRPGSGLAPWVRQGHGKVVNSGAVTSPVRAVRSVRRCTR
jgi:hypothetical protein